MPLYQKNVIHHNSLNFLFQYIAPLKLLKNINPPKKLQTNAAKTAIATTRLPTPLHKACSGAASLASGAGTEAASTGGEGDEEGVGPIEEARSTLISTF